MPRAVASAGLTRASWVAAGLLLFASGACGKSKMQPPDAAPSASAPSAPVFDGPPTGMLRCPYGVGDAGDRTELAYHKRCDSDAQCAIGRHLMDCGGTMIAVGVHVAELPRFIFDAGADICGSGLTCKIMSLGTLAEDGRLGRDTGSVVPRDIAVACVRGACMTRVIDGWKEPP